MTRQAHRKTEAKAEVSKFDLAGKITQQAAKLLDDRAIEVVDKMKDVGNKQLDRVRDVIVERPIESVAAGIAIGMLLRSWLRSPTMTLLMMGGAAYAGYKLAGESPREAGNAR
ncbi:MAG: hypothetical protein QM831_01155 [Kofleriaceae bacterium]